MVTPVHGIALTPRTGDVSFPSGTVILPTALPASRQSLRSTRFHLSPVHVEPIPRPGDCRSQSLSEQCSEVSRMLWVHSSSGIADTRARHDRMEDPACPGDTADLAFIGAGADAMWKPFAIERRKPRRQSEDGADGAE